MLEDIRHLTWNGRASWLYYRLRRVVIAPAPTMDRCVMGSPVGPHVHCPRYAVGDSMWCRRHSLVEGGSK